VAQPFCAYALSVDVYMQCAVLACTVLLTLAGPAVGHHGVALFWAGTLVAPRHVDTAEGAEDAGTLSALIYVCQRKGQLGEPCPLIGPATNGLFLSQPWSPGAHFTREDKRALKTEALPRPHSISGLTHEHSLLRLRATDNHCYLLGPRGTSHRPRPSYLALLDTCPSTH
jgi:hypothetical protein